MKDQIEHFRKLNQNLKKLSEKKIRFEEQLRAKKQAFIELKREIELEGYDPAKLSDIIKEKEAALKVGIADFEDTLTKVSDQLSEIEAA
jgi:hypothetical protein